MTVRHGAVWYGGQRVGALREDETHTLLFTYDPDWLDHGGFPISVNLPLSNGDREVNAHAYFEGLLPEGRVRLRICRQRKIALEDDAGLLFAIGEDCAGALCILPAGMAPETVRQTPAALSADQIHRLVHSHGTEPVIPGRDQRFSLAGVQEKQPVIFDGGSYALPDRLHPSSHILKFETFPRVCFAEFIANQMAKAIGLPVVAVEFLRSEAAGDVMPYLRIQRFDRTQGPAGQLQRLHQEDLLQALGLTTLLKYQQDGGPSMQEVGTALREYTARPIEALENLRDWQIFNYLTGNWDGHGKNLALLYVPGEAVPVLAPFYDLVAIEFFNLVRPGAWSRDMAFYIGEHNVPEQIGRADWEAFARDLGMPPKRLLGRVEELAARLPETAGNAHREFAGHFGDEPVYDQLEESIRRRCHWTLTTLFAK